MNNLRITPITCQNITFMAKKDSKKEDKIPVTNISQEDKTLEQMASNPETLSAMAQIHKTAEEETDNITNHGYIDHESLLKDMAARRLNDFSDHDIDLDFPMIASERQLSEDEIIEFRESISNPSIKKFVDRMFTFDDCNLCEITAALISSMDENLSGIDDDFVKNYVNEKLEKALTMEVDEYGVNYYSELEKIIHIVDAYHEMNGHYTTYKMARMMGPDSIIAEYSKPADLMRNLPPMMREIYAGSDDEPDIDDEYVKDFRNSEKLSSFECIASEPTIGDYLYENYYVNNLDIEPSQKSMLLKINKDFNTKVLISAHSYDLDEELQYIYDEFYSWKKVSKGKADLPGILNISCADKTFLGNVSGYWNPINNGLCLKYGMFEDLVITLRHELVHHFDTQKTMMFGLAKDKKTADLINSIMPSKTIIDEDGDEIKGLDFDNCKYREEFLRAGIEIEHIPYAYTNRSEFIAVAGEGDMSKYSPEFKKVLVKLGMPKYAFNLPCYNPGVQHRARIINDLEQMSGDEKMDFRTLGLMYKSLEFFIEELESRVGDDFDEYDFDDEIDE